MKIFLRCGFLIFLAVALVLVIGNDSKWNSEVPSELGDQVISERVSVMIVPHHLLAKRDIEELFRRVSTQGKSGLIERVVILSPNHFDVGATWVIGSARVWPISSGSLIADHEIMDSLSHDKDVTLEDDILEREHGVRNLLPFVKEYFPYAAIVPLALRDGIPASVTENLAHLFHESADRKRTLVVVSADFSHYLDWNFSRFHDNRSVQVLRDFSDEQLTKLDVDCVGCLRTALAYARFQQTPIFHLVARTSSLEMMGKNIAGEETSHISGYFSSHFDSSRTGESKTVDLLFSGSISPEMMTENSRRAFMSQDANIFEQNGSFVLSSQSFLPHETGFVSQGSQLVDSAKELTLREINGKKVFFIAITNQSTLEASLAAVRNGKEQGDFVVAVWQKSLSNQLQWREWSQSLGESGADVVIGRQQSVSSVVIWHGSIIISSLGLNPESCREGGPCHALFTGVSLSPSKKDAYLLPTTYRQDGMVELLNDPERMLFLKRVARENEDVAVRTMLEQGHITVP